MAKGTLRRAALAGQGGLGEDLGAAGAEATGCPAAHYDVAVVGGGITGCAAAYYLALSGARACLFERSEIGSEASGRNAGSLHGQVQFEPFKRRGEAWARQFLPALELLLSALEVWGSLEEALGAELEVKAEGGLLLADSAEQLRLIERKVALEQEVGLASEVVSRRDLIEMAPYVSTSMLGAGFSPVEGRANPMLAVPAFARCAVEAGAEVFSRSPVLAIERSARGALLRLPGRHVSAERVVLASGDQLAEQAAALGAPLPISREPVQVAATEPLEDLIDHLVYFAGERLTLKQARAGTVLVGGGWPARTEPGTGYPLVDPVSLRANLSVALHVAPRLGEVLVLRSWAGIGHGTPDELPVIGPLPGEAWAIVGLFPYMGFTAGPLMGRALADLALGRDPGFDLAPFSPGRFGGA
jgi:sarcosine oxidase subunit beta